MPTGFLEHVNITVSDPDRSSDLLQQLCGWHERWRGPSQLGGWTIHVGSERDYLAIYTNEGRGGPYAKGQPLNHIGLVVDDLDTAERIVIAAGLEPFGTRALHRPGPMVSRGQVALPLALSPERLPPKR